MNLTHTQTALFFTVYFGSILCGIYVCQFADPRPPDEKASFLTNCNRFISNVLINRIPSALKRTLKFFVGERMFDRLASMVDYALNKRNPLLQLFYLAIINSAYITWLALGQPQLPTVLVPAYHKYVIFSGILACQVCFYVACTTPPGLPSTKGKEDNEGDNCSDQHRYTFDGTLYVDGIDCSTCHSAKQARSKHCRLCDTCVPRFDHHCIWLNQCVGQYNHRWFLAFLGLHVVFLAYCSYISGAVLFSEVCNDFRALSSPPRHLYCSSTAHSFNPFFCLSYRSSRKSCFRRLS